MLIDLQEKEMVLVHLHVHDGDFHDHGDDDGGNDGGGGDGGDEDDDVYVPEEKVK